MAMYAISAEGAEALNQLADRLMKGAGDILDASARLEAAVSALGDDLGVYADDIRSIIAVDRALMLSRTEDVNRLAGRLRGKSLEILDLIDFGGASGGVSTSAGTGQAQAGNGLRPTRRTPRDLPLGATRHGFKRDADGNFYYNAPMETNGWLYTTQGAAYPDYQGTCGLCSCANVLRLAGVDLSEKDMIDYAAHTSAGGPWSPRLCDTGYADPGMNGGTSAQDRKAILAHFGVDSGVIPLGGDPVSQIGQYVAEGRGVIIGVHADALWYDMPPDPNGEDLHAVTVTSVKRDAAGKVLGLYICDSATGGTTYYSADRVLKSLSGGPMNVTYSVIR